MPHTQFGDSGRLDALMRSGNIHLSLFAGPISQEIAYAVFRRYNSGDAQYLDIFHQGGG
jgi:hypothetical protein